MFPREHGCSLGQLKLFFPKGHDRSLGKKNLTCSLWQLKLLFLGTMIVPWGRTIFLGEQWISPRERPKFFRETYVPNLLAIIIISFIFLYRVVTYHWKSLEKSYIFCNWKHFNQNLHTKVIFTQSFGHGCSLKEHGLSCSLGKHGCSLGEHGLGCSPKEQMCQKLCVYITFACEFWLNCLQLKSCSYPRDLSNDKSQVHYSPRKLVLPQGTIMPLGRNNLSCPK